MSGHRFNRVTYGVPVETFEISAYISVAERLPIVTEFVLKVVHTCESIRASALREFFGFSQAESLAVVEAMCRRSLLVMEGDVLRLTQYAQEQFQGDEKNPSFHKIVPAKDSITFDLLTFFPIPNGGLTGEGKGGGDQRSSEGSIKLDAPDEALGQSVELARTAYRQNYDQIAFRREGSRDRNYGVYSIEDIQGGRRRYAPINVNFILDEDGHVQRQYDEQFHRVAPPELVNAVTEQVTRSLPSTLKAPRAALEEFTALFDLRFLQPYVRDGGVDLPRYMADVHAGSVADVPRGVYPLFGNAYLTENLSDFAEGVESRLQGKRRKSPLKTSVVWLAPEYALWGRGESFAQAVRKLRNILDAEGQDIHVCAFASPEQERDVREQLRGPALARLHCIRPRSTAQRVPMGGALEILLMPGGLLCAMLHMPIPGSEAIWAPIGFRSSNAKHLEAARTLLVDAMTDGGYEGSAESGPRTEHQSSLERDLPFMFTREKSDEEDEDIE